MLRGLAHAELRLAITILCVAVLGIGLRLRLLRRELVAVPRPERHRRVDRDEPAGRVRSREPREVEGARSRRGTRRRCSRTPTSSSPRTRPRKTPTSCSCSRSIARPASSCGSTKSRGCRKAGVENVNGPASPSPVTDGANVYFFFQDFGLISYTADGKERWRMPLGPFNMFYGFGASPILEDGKLILAGRSGHRSVPARGRCEDRQAEDGASRGRT